jgi:hypothetical protein
MIWPFKKKTKWLPERTDAWPWYVNGKRSLACWTDQECKHRIFLIERPDGNFEIVSEFFSEDEYEMCWLLTDRGNSICDSEETAVREIHGRFPWTINVEPEKQGAEH